MLTEFNPDVDIPNVLSSHEFLARILWGFGMPAVTTDPVEIDGFTVEAVGIPGRGMDDELGPISYIEIDEDSFERGIVIPDTAAGQT